MSIPALKHIEDWYIKPKHDVEDAKQPYYLTPWDLRLLSIHYDQKGLLYRKPGNQRDFSMGKLLESLKESLSLALVHFYPLAGQLASQVDEDKHESLVFIDCNKGPGARFIHASLDMFVSDIVSPSSDDPSVIYSLFDHNDGRIVSYDGISRPLLSIQVTELLDGVFIGCSMNHAVGDGDSLWRFWNAWSELQRANNMESVSISRPPVHTRWFPDGCGSALALPFIHPDEFVRRYQPNCELRVRVFHFSSESMGRLKAKCNEETNSNKISSFQAFSALICRSFARAKGLSTEEVVQCTIAANNRSRLDPPLPRDYFGNSLSSIRVATTVGELLGHNLAWVASLIHDVVASHGDKVVRNLLEKWKNSPWFADIGAMAASNSMMLMGSSPRFEIYTNELTGLGTPVAVRSGFGNKFEGRVSSYPGSEGGGSVDLEICLMPDSMAALELDQEFMAFASTNK